MEGVLQKDLEAILSKTKHLFEKCKKEKFFITGGTGFFGRWFLESLLWANRKLDLDVQILVLTRDPERFIQNALHLKREPALNFLAGDISSFIFPGGRFANIIHAATETNHKSDSIEMFDSNVNGTRRVLEFARLCGNKRLLLTSSGAVYGKQPANIKNIPEDYSGAPDTTDINTSYGQSKRVSEFLCAHYAREFGLNVKIARCFAFLGPYLPLSANYAAGNFVRDALKGGPINVKGDGTACRSYLYTTDLMIWLWTILFEGKACRPYNVGSPEAISIRDLAYAVAKAFNPPLKVEIENKVGKVKDAELYIPDTSLAEKELGLQQLIELREGINKTVGFYKQARKKLEVTWWKSK
ncbi:MAG: NAD-dependent epimerase/dehydratase family protein [Candidatus Omnitrophica bacterium]|nr:NAD-dependent epimerase/dehydratase family protein [Candidatus Omnitrophota bacterium]